MKTIRELCKIMGVTRKTLRGYEEIGLLIPIEKPEKNHPWLYDDSALSDLSVIQMFVEAGYERKQIKEIMDSIRNGSDPKDPYQVLLKELRNKRKKLDIMIRHLETQLDLYSKLSELTNNRVPKSVYSIMESINDYAGKLHEMFEARSKYDEDQMQFMELATTVINRFLILECLRDKDPSDKSVQLIVDNILLDIIDSNLLEMAIEGIEKYSFNMKKIICLEYLKTMWKELKDDIDEETETLLNRLFDKEDRLFIRQALRVYYQECLKSTGDNITVSFETC